MNLTKTYPYILIFGGLTGIITSFLLTLDKIQLLENPKVVLPCNINPLISCGNVIQSWQGAAFGVPNPMLGLIGFSIVFATGVMMLFGAVMKKKFWYLFLFGLTAAIAFIHWLIYQSIFQIGNLCLYCMITWAAIWPIFVYTFVKVLRERAAENPVQNKGENIFIKNHLALLIGWYLLILLAILSHFRDFFFH